MATQHDTRTALDFDDLATLKAGQLRTLLSHACGDSAGCFHGLPRDLQDDYHALCLELAETLVDALAEVGRQQLKARDLNHPG